MFNALIKTLLILTALTPICLVYACVAISESYYLAAGGLLIGVILLVSVCWIVLKLAHSKLPTFSFQFTSVEPADQENISFLLLYLSPLFVDQISSVNFAILLPALGVYALLMATSYTFHFNPMLSLMGWHFYKVSSKEGVTYVLLTTKKIINVDRLNKVGQLTGYMLLDLSE